jgi:hypothetical protein
VSGGAPQSVADLAIVPRSSPFPSELFLARMNAAADSDVTVVLRCRDRAQRTAAFDALRAAASIPPVRGVGERARRVEAIRRHPVQVGSGRYGLSTRVGPVDIALADDEESLLVRWSHLAGDARTCHAFLTSALAPLDPAGASTACRCVEFPPGADRPLVPADVWKALRRAGIGSRSAARASGPALLPLLRPLRPPVGVPARASRGALSGSDANDAIAVLEAAHPSTPAAGSRFVALAGGIAALIARASARRVVRVGLTVDVRRHEQLPLAGTAGNLAVIGYVNVPSSNEDEAAAELHAGVRALLRRSFWRQQLAFDSWLARLPRRAVERGCDVIVRHASRLAPLVVTELWRDDAPRCERCDRRRRRLPHGASAVVIPPALPPAGLSCGITLGRDAATIVLRRVTPPGISAARWLGELVSRGAQQALEIGPIEW